MPEAVATPARLADVAQAAGVSQATVSRVLGGSDHKVSAATSRRVRNAAKKLGYRVNPIARALRSSSTGSVGMVVPGITNPFFIELVDQVEQRLAAHGVNLYLCDARGSVEVEATRLKSLSNGLVDGVIVVPVHSTGSEPAIRAASNSVAVVQLDRQVESLRIPWVGVDDRPGIADLMAHLAERNVSSIAMFTNPSASLSATTRTNEVSSQAKKLGMMLQPEQIFDVGFSIEGGELAVEALMSSTQALPDAVVCIDDILAIGAISEFRRREIVVPDDILVTGFDDIQFSSVVAPRLTTVRQPLAQIAAEGVRLLRNMSDARSGISVAIPGQLMVRESTGLPAV